MASIALECHISWGQIVTTRFSGVKNTGYCQLRRLLNGVEFVEHQRSHNSKVNLLIRHWL